MTSDGRPDDLGERDAPVEDAVDEHDDAAPANDADAVDGDDDVHDDAGGPSWWHRDHPVFTPLMGFFTGLLTAVVVPGAYAAILSQLFDADTAEGLFPFVAVLLVVPLALLAFARTRRFGRYMFAGMVLTTLVVVAVSALTLWILVTLDS